MKPDEVLARRVAREIELEMESIGRLQSELESAPGGDDTFALRARGSILHDFYTGVERVFVRLAEEINGGVPRGDQWHRQLVRDTSIAIPDVRPAVISPELVDDLQRVLIAADTRIGTDLHVRVETRQHARGDAWCRLYPFGTRRGRRRTSATSTIR